LTELGADHVREGWAGVDIGPLVNEGVPGIGHRTHSDDYFWYHHSPADTYDKIDPTALAENVAALTWLLHRIVADPVPLKERAAPGTH
jgi:carboxypeptidase Q